MPLPLKLLAAALAALTCGCGPALAPFDANAPAHVVSYIGAPPVQDARGRFRQIFCGLLEEHRPQLGLYRACDSYLWRLTDEHRAGAVANPLPRHDPSLVILIVPGAFGACFGDSGKPFREAAENLRGLGYHIAYVPVGGLSGSPKNAGIIAKAVAGLDMRPHQRLIILGYSKGVIDTLHFLVHYPQQARRVTAVLSVAGAALGSPLADRFYSRQYESWLDNMLPETCGPGDGGVLSSLGRVKQLDWLAAHPLPDHVRYFSLAAFARYEDTQLLLRPTYKMLASTHPFNDGQLVFSEQLVPGSTLLGYANADHWTVALSIEDRFSNRDRASRDRNRSLRGLLFEAMVLFLAESLPPQDSGGSTRVQ